jgi:hypothetical protein
VRIAYDRHYSPAPGGGQDPGGPSLGTSILAPRRHGATTGLAVRGLGSVRELLRRPPVAGASHTRCLRRADARLPALRTGPPPANPAVRGAVASWREEG